MTCVACCIRLADRPDGTNIGRGTLDHDRFGVGARDAAPCADTSASRESCAASAIGRSRRSRRRRRHSKRPIRRSACPGDQVFTYARPMFWKPYSIIGDGGDEYHGSVARGRASPF
jgi:hypothetical protein